MNSYSLLYKVLISGKVEILDYEDESICIIWLNANRRVFHKEWYSKGQLHRINDPAVEWSDGTKFWYNRENMIKVRKYGISKEIA